MRPTLQKRTYLYLLLDFKCFDIVSVTFQVQISYLRKRIDKGKRQKCLVIKCILNVEYYRTFSFAYTARRLRLYDNDERVIHVAIE